MRTPADLQQFIDTHAVQAQILLLTAPTPTVAAAAEVLGVTPDQIGKSVLFMVTNGSETAEPEPILIVATGLGRIDWKALATYLGISRRQLKMADETQVLHHTGFPVGTVPPIGHPRPLRTLIDTQLMTQTEIYAGGGGHTALMRITPTELQLHTQGTVVALVTN